MKAHDLKAMPSTIFCLAVLVAPILRIVLALIGLTIYALTGDQETALWLCGIALGVAIVFAPMAMKMFSKPTIVISSVTSLHDHRQ